MAEAVVLGELDLDTVTELWIDEQRQLALDPIPGWDGDLVQDLGSHAVRIHLRGVDHGEDVGGRIEALRQAAAEGGPLDFTASAAAASLVERVLIHRLRVHQPGGRERLLGYELDLVQYVEPPPPTVGGFDAGFLDELGGLADAAALEDLGGFVDDLPLGELDELGQTLSDASAALDAAGEALAAVEDVVAFVEDAAGALENLAKIEELIAAAGGVIDAAT